MIIYVYKLFFKQCLDTFEKMFQGQIKITSINIRINKFIEKQYSKKNQKGAGERAQVWFPVPPYVAS